MKRYPLYMDANDNTNFEARLTAALEHRPEPTIPADFATRLAAQLPALKPARRRVNASRSFAVLAAVICVLALAWLAPHATPSYSSVSFDLELLLFAQLAFIAYWLTTRREV